MKTRRLITLIVGITSLALSSVTWAAGHGGGGGGGFSGGGRFGGFPGGGFRGGGIVTGGVGTRGGGVGFGAMRPSYGAPNFAGAGSRFSSFGRPSSKQPAYDGRSTRSMTQSGGITAPNQQQNRFASIGSREQGARPEVPRQLAQRFPSLSKHIAAEHDTNWHNDWDRRHFHFDHGRFFVFIDGFWCGLDAGYFPWDYLPYYPNDYYPYDYYADVDPYDYSGDNNYNVDPAESATVQTVQMQLARLGYYNGSIDGVFGPSTRDAVARYQIANQLNVTGSLSPDTLQSLGLTQATPS
jgi:hypothetical protein